jgi:hypothetical protein
VGDKFGRKNKNDPRNKRPSLSNKAQQVAFIICEPFGIPLITVTKI